MIRRNTHDRAQSASARIIELGAVPDHLMKAWEQLADEASAPNIFHEPWLVAPAATLAGRAPDVVMVWHDTADGIRLDGVLPLATKRVRGIALAAENWDNQVRALGEPLVRRGAEAVFWAAALDAIAAWRGRGWYLRLSMLIADSASTQALSMVARARGCAPVVTRSYERALLVGGGTARDYAAATMRSKVLKEHRRLRNRLGDMGGLAFERLAPDADAASWIDDLFRLELTGWKGRDGVAAAAEPARAACFRTILLAAHARGRLDFHRMTVGGTVIAALAVIEAPGVGGDEGFQLKIAYDEAWAGWSPGVLLEMAYLDHALDARGLARVDSCARANHPMIDRLWRDRLGIVSLAIPYPTRRSRWVCALRARAQRARSLRSSMNDSPIAARP